MADSVTRKAPDSPVRAVQNPRRKALTIGVCLAVVATAVSVVPAAASPELTLTNPVGPQASDPANSDPTTTQSADPTISLEPRAGLAAKINWRNCRPPEIRDLKGVQCGRYTVPQDYAKPKGPTFKLKVYRLKALPRNLRGGKPIKGSIFANPGGPGASGVDLLRGLTDLRKRFHVVTWAPRGVADSTPLLRDCPPGPVILGTSAYPQTGPFTWQKMARVNLDQEGPSSAFCYGSNARLVTTIGTNNVVQDLDAMRAAVGDKALTYIGYSYGTRIGRLYAQTYPSRVRAMVLDGVVDPTETMEEFAVQGTRGGEASFKYTKRALNRGELRAYKSVNRFLQTGVVDGLDRFLWWTVTLQAGNSASSLATLKAASCELAAELELPGCNGVTGTRRSLNDQVRKLKKQQQKLTRTSALTTLINCVDLRGRPNPAQIGDYLDRTVRSTLAGQIGRLNGLNYGSTCLGVPLPADPVPNLPNGLRMPHPPLMINGKGDALTPYVGAKQTHTYIPGSRLITTNSSRHGTYWGPQVNTPCITGPVTKYLYTQKLPKKNVYCKRAFR
jgi:pimeloyl-ACP methyl ester carboxylesterase